jgi:hypothetical protein
MLPWRSFHSISFLFSGINTLNPTLGLLKRYRLINIDEMFGFDWCIRDSVTSFAVIGMSKQSVFQVEVIGDIDQVRHVLDCFDGCSD